MVAKESTSLKRAYCPKCKTENELDRIFYVNPDADVCYCPICMSELKPRQVIDNYNFFVSQKINKADRLLYQETKFYEAYCAFGDIIEMDPSQVRARFGRILALVYMSKLRKTNFLNALTLLTNEAETFFRKMKDQDHYVKFLTKVNSALDEYLKRFPKRISVKERFYNLDCVELYYTRLYEILEMKTFVFEEIKKVEAKIETNRIATSLNLLEQSVRDVTKMFEKRVITVEGSRYKVTKVVGPQHIVVSKLDERAQPLARYPKHKLDENEKKGKLINDKVYPDNSHLTSHIRFGIPALIITIIAAATALAFSFFAKDTLLLVLLILSIFFFVLSVTSMILLIVWKSQLSKRRHLID